MAQESYGKDRRMNEAMKKNLETYRKALERIRADRDLNADARGRLMEEAYADASANHARLVEEDRGQVARAYDDAARSVFAPPAPRGTPGAERVAVQSSYRDALFRVSEVEGDGLHKLQRMAAATGDRLLSRAVLHRGYELEDRGVVEAATTADPEIGKAWESFMDAAEEVNRAESDPFRYAGPDRPPELDGDQTAVAG